MILIPKAGHLLIRPIAPTPLSSDLIVIADVYDLPETTGVVVELPATSRCPECGYGQPSEVARGDVVLFPASAGSVCELEGERYLVMPESVILAVVSDGVEAEVSA